MVRTGVDSREAATMGCRLSCRLGGNGQATEPWQEGARTDGLRRHSHSAT